MEATPLRPLILQGVATFLEGLIARGEGVGASNLIEPCSICYQLLPYWILDPQLATSMYKWPSQLKGSRGERWGSL